MTVVGLRRNDDEKWADSEEEMVWVEGCTPFSTERNWYWIGNVGVGKGGQKRITGTLVPGKGPEIWLQWFVSWLYLVFHLLPL